MAHKFFACLRFGVLSISNRSFIGLFVILYSGFRQVRALRAAFLRGVLRQEPAWFDLNGGVGKVLQVTCNVLLEM